MTMLKYFGELSTQESLVSGASRSDNLSIISLRSAPSAAKSAFGRPLRRREIDKQVSLFLSS
jgi:hypothetical protein